MEKDKRAVGYIRVSTDKQAKYGVSLEAQQSKIAAMVQLQDAKLLEIIQDDESGKSLDRPGMQRIIEMVKRQEIDLLIVFKLDRLTRSVVDLNELVTMFNKYKVSLVSLSESIDTGSASGWIVMNLLTVVSHWERLAISERTTFALRHKKSTRKQLFNHDPYGYNRINFTLDAKGKKVGGELKADPVEMEIAREIIERRAMLSGQPSLRHVAESLNQRGIPAKRGGKWYASAIANIVNNWKLYEL